MIFSVMFACVMVLMVAVLMGICHPFDSNEEIVLARILLLCTSVTIAELGKMVFLAFLYLLVYSNDDGGGVG